MEWRESESFAHVHDLRNTVDLYDLRVQQAERRIEESIVNGRLDEDRWRQELQAGGKCVNEAIQGMIDEVCSAASTCVGLCMCVCLDQQDPEVCFA